MSRRGSRITSMVYAGRKHRPSHMFVFKRNGRNWEIDFVIDLRTRDREECI
jgi:hypothetical protein